MGLIQRLWYNTNNRKIAIIIAALVVAVIIAFIIFLAVKPSSSDNKEVTYATYKVDMVHMEQTLTAAGKVTTGEAENVDLIKGKTVKAVCVSKKEAVKKGQALVYYTDGTHTDAPIDSVITAIHAPKNGSAVSDSHSISFNNIQDLYLKVTVPEDQINNISKGDEAEIVINAKPHVKYYGEIIDKKDISTTLLSNKKQEASDAESETTNDDESTGDEESEDVDEDADEEDDEVGADEDAGYDDEEGEGEGSNAYYSVNIRFDNDGTIRPGMSASCLITISNRDDVLAVPIEAVSFDEEGNAFVIGAEERDGEEIPVKIGSSDAMNVEIKDGLKKGDRIKYEQTGNTK